MFTLLGVLQALGNRGCSACMTDNWTRNTAVSRKQSICDGYGRDYVLRYTDMLLKISENDKIQELRMYGWSLMHQIW